MIGDKDLSSFMRSSTCRNQSIDLEFKSVDWLLCHRDLHQERLKFNFNNSFQNFNALKKIAN